MELLVLAVSVTSEYRQWWRQNHNINDVTVKVFIMEKNYPYSSLWLRIVCYIKCHIEIRTDFETREHDVGLEKWRAVWCLVIVLFPFISHFLLIFFLVFFVSFFFSPFPFFVLYFLFSILFPIALRIHICFYCHCYSYFIVITYFIHFFICFPPSNFSFYLFFLFCYNKLVPSIFPPLNFFVIIIIITIDVHRLWEGQGLSWKGALQWLSITIRCP